MKFLNIVQETHVNTEESRREMMIDFLKKYHNKNMDYSDFNDEELYHLIIPPVVIESKLVLRSNRVNLDEDILRERYVVEMKNLSEIAKEFSTTRNTIRRKLEKMGIPIRSKINQKKKQVQNKP